MSQPAETEHLASVMRTATMIIAPRSMVVAMAAAMAMAATAAVAMMAVAAMESVATAVMARVMALGTVPACMRMYLTPNQWMN